MNTVRTSVHRAETPDVITVSSALQAFSGLLTESVMKQYYLPHLSIAKQALLPPRHSRVCALELLCGGWGWGGGYWGNPGTKSAGKEVGEKCTVTGGNERPPLTLFMLIRLGCVRHHVHWIYDVSGSFPALSDGDSTVFMGTEGLLVPGVDEINC